MSAFHLCIERALSLFINTHSSMINIYADEMNYLVQFHDEK